MLQLPPSTLPNAACRGMVTDIFFPGRGNGYKKPKTICNGDPDTDACPDRAACLDLVLSFEVPGTGARAGVWGGMTANERDQVFGKVEDLNDGEEPAGHGQTLLSDYLPAEGSAQWAV